MGQHEFCFLSCLPKLPLPTSWWCAWHTAGVLLPRAWHKRCCMLRQKCVRVLLPKRQKSRMQCVQKSLIEI